MRYVTHDPFGYALRIENTRASAVHVTAAITLGTAALSGVMWWALRRSIRHIPETRQWIEEVSTS